VPFLPLYFGLRRERDLGLIFPVHPATPPSGAAATGLRGLPGFRARAAGPAALGERRRARRRCSGEEASALKKIPFGAVS
jgi:hypothetical protein